VAAGVSLLLTPNGYGVRGSALIRCANLCVQRRGSLRRQLQVLDLLRHIVQITQLRRANTMGADATNGYLVEPILAHYSTRCRDACVPWPCLEPNTQRRDHSML
jgi:hypothetical protein